MFLKKKLKNCFFEKKTYLKQKNLFENKFFVLEKILEKKIFFKFWKKIFFTMVQKSRGA